MLDVDLKPGGPLTWCSIPTPGLIVRERYPAPDAGGAGRRALLRLPRRRRRPGRVLSDRRRNGSSATVARMVRKVDVQRRRSTPRSSRSPADRPGRPRSCRLRVMISCGEPSGDLYAGALAREIRGEDPRRRSPASAASACARPARRSSETSAGCRSPGSSRSSASCRGRCRRIGAWSPTRRADVRTSSSRSIFPTSISAWRARCASSASRSSTTSARSSGPGAPAG